jgi:hypothetical protein
VTERAPIDAARKHGVRYFASGSNHPGEILGLARSGVDVGCAATEIAAASEAALVAAARHYGVRIFVDSGAFSEVTFGPSGPSVKRPILETDWAARLDTYERIARQIGPKLHCVAPDKVGFQAETLSRLLRWSGRMSQIARYGATILVPCQKGAASLVDFWRSAQAILAIGDRAIPAIPMKKDATSLADLLAFVAAARPRAIHLLGLGVKSPRYAETVAALRELAPQLEIQCDSVLITSLVGRTNGRNGGPRPLTAAQDAVRAARPGATVAEVKCEALMRLLAPVGSQLPLFSEVA